MDEGRNFLVSICAHSIVEDDDLENDLREMDSVMVSTITARDDVFVTWERVKDAAGTDDTC